MPVNDIQQRVQPMDEDSIIFRLNLIQSARILASSGDHLIRLPYHHGISKSLKEIKIGFYGNIANNSYNIVKCLRQEGYDAELVLEEEYYDSFLLNRPFWEDLSISCSSYEEGYSYEKDWIQPHFVRRISYNTDMQLKYRRRFVSVLEVQEIYQRTFGLELSIDRALVLANYMGYWPLIESMKRYDLIQFSGAPICLGMFCPKPYVILPTGSDLFISPFEETLFGLMVRAGYRGARGIIYCASNYPDYLKRLNITSKCTFLPLMIDTETYSPGEETEVRSRWQKLSGGTRFLLSVCRQSWDWKGNDKLLYAFKSFLAHGGESWRLVLMKWGNDVEKTKGLIRELGLEKQVIWENLSSKPLLRKCQQAADIITDQFVMEGYGTSVLESLAAGKPVILNFEGVNREEYKNNLPPFIHASTVDEIFSGLKVLQDDQFRERKAKESLLWIQAVHGRHCVMEKYLNEYAYAIGL